jgi:hypothetical protein
LKSNSDARADADKGRFFNLSSHSPFPDTGFLFSSFGGWNDAARVAPCLALKEKAGKQEEWPRIYSQRGKLRTKSWDQHRPRHRICFYYRLPHEAAPTTEKDLQNLKSLTVRKIGFSRELAPKKRPQQGSK